MPERPAQSVQPSLPAPISAGRAYTEVLLVFALFYAASIIAAGESLVSPPAAPTGGWADYTPAAVQNVATAALAALVVILLAARRGVTARSLGACPPVGADGKTSVSRAIRMAAVALIALIIGGAITTGLATGHFPRPANPTGPYLLYSVAGSLLSGVSEEMVVLAFVVTTLRQARRPVAEILIVAVLIRCSYHIYYGVGVIGIAVWAAVFVLLFLRFGSVIPLIVLHFVWDSVQFLGERWAAVAGIGVLFGVVLLIWGLVAWLVDVFSRRAARKRQPAYPGYYQQQPHYPPPSQPPPGSPHPQYPQAPLYPQVPQYPQYPQPPQSAPGSPQQQHPQPPQYPQSPQYPQNPEPSQYPQSPPQA